MFKRVWEGTSWLQVLLGYVYGMSTLGIGMASGNIFCGFGFGTG